MHPSPSLSRDRALLERAALRAIRAAAEWERNQGPEQRLELRRARYRKNLRRGRRK